MHSEAGAGLRRISTSSDRRAALPLSTGSRTGASLIAGAVVIAFANKSSKRVDPINTGPCRSH
jgi:hypothetical protein